MAAQRKRKANATPRSSSVRGLLTREIVVEAGLRISRREDLSELTIRKLADELNVTPMAVYRHFSNKAEIIAGVLDLFVREAAVTCHESSDWKEWIRLSFSSMREALLEAPGILSELGNLNSFGLATFSILDEVLAVLKQAKIDEGKIVEAFFTLMGYTLGVVGLEISMQRIRTSEHHGMDAAEQERLSRLRFESQSQLDFPNIVQLAPYLAAAIGQFPFEEGLNRIIESLDHDIQLSGREIPSTA